ncbi:MAG: alpha-amylase [Candidatus Micrarchaeota archaeon]|nr:alpha-amylase [Candidatus Micrarchaeota archaeon]
MPDVSLVFEVHQPLRLKKFGVDRSASTLYDRYFSDEFNKEVFDKVATKCYYPATYNLLESVHNLKDSKKPFKISFSITGLWLEQAEKWHPDLIELFRQFPKKTVEFLDETYYHSLIALHHDMGEFIEQLKEHRALMKSVFGVKPKVMTNTELIYNNVIAKTAAEAGYKGIFTEGHPGILGWQSPNYVYKPPFYVTDKIKVLLRNRNLTDDLGYRFSAKWWNEWPLTAEKYSAWVAGNEGQCINLFMDYETFGEHHWDETGIFWFLSALPHKINEYEHLRFATPSEVIEKHDALGEFDVYEMNSISWADIEMDVSAWLGNEVQRTYFEELKRLEHPVKQTKDKELIRIWKLLQCSDHLHNICTKWWGDGDVHQYFSYFDHPQQGFATLTDVLLDFKERVYEKLMENGRK